MRYSLIFLVLLITSCSNQTEDKEKELLKKELELAKRELSLSEREKEIETRESSVPQNETVVFSTKQLSSRKSIKIDGKHYNITFAKTYIEGEEPPSARSTRISFSPNVIPDIVVDGDVYSIAIRDLNLDGKQEVIASTLSNGTWASIYAFERVNNKWKEAFDSFMWWTGGEGCPAKIYWTTGKNQIRILTTNSATENFDCSQEIIHHWD